MRPGTKTDPRAQDLAAFLRAIALAAGLLASSCAQAPAVDSFAWTGGGGERLAFTQERGWEPGSEAVFGADRISNRYVLQKPLSLKAGMALEVSIGLVRGPDEARLRLSLGGTERKAAPLLVADFPIRDGTSQLVLPLDSDSRIGSLSVELGQGQAKGAIRVEAIAVRPAFRGIERIEGGVRVSSGFSIRLEGGHLVLALSRPFVSVPPGPGQRLALEFRYPPFTGAATAELRGEAGAKPLHLRLREAGGTTVFGPELFPPGLARLEISVPERVGVPALFAAHISETEAELADLGRVLLSAPADPLADYSIYRWDILPSVIIIDFRDYSTQDSYLKRLAFFVEKAGFRGRLAGDAEIAALHGWNAHDYRSEDLAAFFEAARSKAFVLGKVERGLEALLLERGIIARRSGRIVAGQGALISISRESPSYQRLTLLVHESTHGIFFSDSAYRDFARSQWASVPKDERWFWRLYFDWANYDVSSDYLMANEYQAYLLQQPVSRAEDYFTKTLPARLVEKHPERQAALDAYMARFGKRFAEGAMAFETWLGKRYGISAGRTWFLD